MWRSEIGGSVPPYVGTQENVTFWESIAKHQVKHTFGNIAKTRAVRKEELLRSMVSQGRPDSLRHSFKVLRSDSAKIKAKL